MPRKKSPSKHRKNRTKKNRKPKSKTRTKPRTRKDRKRRSKHGDKRRQKDKREQSAKRNRQRSATLKPHPEMTNAAMNENLGNIVLVKNRHKTSQTSDANVISAQPQMAPTQTNALRGPTTKTTDHVPKTMPATKLMPTAPSTNVPYPRKDYPYGSSYPPDVNMVPLAGTASSTPTTSPMVTGSSAPKKTEPTTTGTTITGTTASGTTATGSTATGTTASGTIAATGTTTLGTTTDVAGGAATTLTATSTTRNFGVTSDKADEITKKEVGQHDPEKSGCDKAQKWKTYMEKVMEGGTEGMQADFRLIRGYLPPTATRTAFDANMEKNRFEDVVCIDQTRVRLNCGSYIHASWVNITATKKAILTQLPVRESAAEFWQMVLDTDVQAILLILTYAEYNMFHANCVFPGEQDFLHFDESHIRVGEFRRVVIDRDWTMHVISVRTGDHKRFVHMHHYSGWTHGKQPSRVLDLWQIQSTFRKYSSPHIYMSLSGCGRAGTYAAFEIAHERLHSDSFSKLNINECICRARNGRMHAVQRPIQMQTIHACIMEHIMATKFASQLPPKTVSKYEEFSSRFNKCAELQEDMK